MADDVRAWRADPAVNHGWIVVGEENRRAYRAPLRRARVAVARGPSGPRPRLFPNPIRFPCRQLVGSWGRLKVLLR
jgi:hypothetical protein